MPVLELITIATSLPPSKRLMGLDIGSKTIGLALSDVNRTIATPLITLKREKFSKDAAELERLIDQYDIGALILGLPISMDGSEGPRCQSTRQFATNLLQRRDIVIGFQDERLSTAAVERFLIGEADMTRKRRAQVVDRAAAAYILQGALDAMAHQA